jgi:hypothetical protein
VSRLERSQGLLHPPGCASWIGMREARRRHTQRLLERHRWALRALARFPFVRLVALSGACAHGNAADNDVDVFLVTRKGRAWSVLAALMLLSKLFGLRRSLCLNYTIDEDALAVPERDFYTAAEIAGMRPLAGRATYRSFVARNAWVGERFPNFFARHLRDSETVPEAGAPRLLEAVLDLGLAPLAEAVSRSLLGAYLAWRGRGRRGVSLSPQRLKLHLDDHGPRLVQAFARALGSQAPRVAERPLRDAEGMESVF